MSATAPDHDRWADDLGAYLLEALPDDERQGFETHLEACERCREDLAELNVAACALPVSVEQFFPPPALRGRIMAVVNAEAELLAAAGPGADRPDPARSRRRFGLPSLRPAVALVGVAGLLLLGGVVGVALDQDERTAPERTVVAQVDENFAEGASAKLVVHETDSRLEVANMPIPRRDRVYQVWLKRPGKAEEPTSALFVPRSDGTGSVVVPGSLEGVDQVLVTSEPKGGSRRPTTSPIIAASPS